MPRTLTPGTSVESLKKEAKARLKDARAHDPNSGTTLRDMQHTIAQEYGCDGWATLVDRIDAARGAGSHLDPLFALMKAAGTGNLARATEILDAHPDVVNGFATFPGHDGRRTPLHFAVAHEPLVKLLLERGADPNIRDDGDNAYPLHFACENQDLPVITLLIEHGADPIGEGDLHELGVLGWSCAWDYVDTNWDVVNYLLAHGARHTIFTAVALGDIGAIRDIVSRSPAHLDQPMDRTNHRRRPLHLAVIKRQAQSLSTLLELGAPLESEDAARLTPLDQAALQNDLDLAQALIDRGAAIRLPAAMALQRTADIEQIARDEPGSLRPGGKWATLIVRAAERSPAHVLETLIRLGAAVDAVDDSATAMNGASRFTPLHLAASKGNLAAIDVLLKHGANPTIRETKWCATAAGWADYFKRTAARDRILAGPIDLFQAIDFERADRIPDIVQRDPEALHRPFRAYADLPEREGQRWPTPEATPLSWATDTGKTDATKVLTTLGARR